MGIVFILLSIAIVIFCVFKGLPVFYSAFIASAFCLLTAWAFTGGVDIIAGMTSTANLADPTAAGTYVTGLAKYFGNNFWLFVLGAIFGKLFEVSGAADSVADAIIGKMGAKAVVPAIILCGWVLTMGGVSVFVCFFAMYPLMVAMCKEADIPRRLLVLLYFSGAGTSTGWMPGSPAAHNTIPCEFLGVPYTAWLVPGVIFNLLQMVMVVIFTMWCVNHAKKNGEHFEMNEADKRILAEAAAKDKSKRPSPLLAAIPMIVLLVVLNIVKMSVAVSLFVGIIAAIIAFAKALEWPKFWSFMNDGCMNGVAALFNTAAIVGFGTVVQATPTFPTLVGIITGIFSNPLVASVVTIGALAGVTGSGTGGLGIALPVVKEYFLAAGNVNLEVLARCSAIAALTLDSLPHCGLVVTVISYTGNKHKGSYLPMAAVNVAAPIIIVTLMMIFATVSGQVYV